MAKKQDLASGVLEEVRKDRNYEKLQVFDDPAIRLKLKARDKAALAMLYFEHGSGLVFSGRAEGDADQLQRGVQCFERCAELAPKQPHYRLAVASARTALGQIASDGDVLVKASELINELETIEIDEHWHFDVQLAKANLYRIMGAISGEISDLKRSLDVFSGISKSTHCKAAYWIEYATAMHSMGLLLARPEVLLQAVSLLNEAIEIEGDGFVARLTQADIYIDLYEMTGQDAYFQLADKSFIVCVKNFVSDTSFWLSWGRLSLMKGELIEDADLLQQACEAFSKGYDCGGSDPLLQSNWGKALALLGLLEDAYHKIQEGESKVAAALEESDQDLDIWCHMGQVLFYKAVYFEDDEILLQSLDKLDHAIEMDTLATSSAMALFCGLRFRASATGDADITDEALEIGRRLVELKPYSIPYRGALAEILLLKAEQTQDPHAVAESINVFEGFVHEPTGCSTMDADHLYYYGCALDLAGDFEDSDEFYDKAAAVQQKVLALEPEHESALYALGWALAHAGEFAADSDKLEKALECFKQVLARNPEEGSVWHDIGVTLLCLTQVYSDAVHADKRARLIEEAGQKLSQAVHLGASVALYTIACLYSLQNQADEAVHYLEKAVAQDALPSLEEMMHDEWLENIRDTQAFTTFVETTFKR